MTDSMKFGPEWLRNRSSDNLSNNSLTISNNASSYIHHNNNSSGISNNNNNSQSSSAVTTTAPLGPPRQLAEFRYGREEMLSLYDKNMKAPEILPAYKKLYVDKLQCPLALTPSTEDDSPIPVTIQQRPWSLRSPVGFSGSSSIRGTGRGGSIDRGGRGKSRGSFLHSNMGTYQRPTALYDDEIRSGGGGNGGPGNILAVGKSMERGWAERNGMANNDSNNIDWNGSPSSSPRKEFGPGGLGGSGGGSHAPLGMGTGLGSRSASNYMDSWRRTRMEEESSGGGGGSSEGWRGHIMSNSLSSSSGNNYRWGRSTSWREDDNNSGAPGMQRSFSNTATSGVDHRNNIGGHNSGPFSNHHHHSFLGQMNSSSGGNSSFNNIKHNSIGNSNSNAGGAGQWNPNSDQEDLLPEWATENPTDSGGSFDATGAFHGSNDDENENRSSPGSDKCNGTENGNTSKSNVLLAARDAGNDSNVSTETSKSNEHNLARNKKLSNASDNSAKTSRSSEETSNKSELKTESTAYIGSSDCNDGLFNQGPLINNKAAANKDGLDATNKTFNENYTNTDTTADDVSLSSIKKVYKDTKLTDSVLIDSTSSKLTDFSTNLQNKTDNKNSDSASSNLESKINSNSNLTSSTLNCNNSKNQAQITRNQNNFNEIPDRMQEVDEMVAKLITDDEISTTTNKKQSVKEKMTSPTNYIMHQQKQLQNKQLQQQKQEQQKQKQEQEQQIQLKQQQQTHLHMQQQKPDQQQLHQQQTQQNVQQSSSATSLALGNTILPQVSQISVSHASQTATQSVVTNADWYYRDPQGKVQGPFSATEMAEWYRAGYFDENLYVRRACDIRYAALGELVKLCGNSMPFLSSHLIPPLTADINPNVTHTQQQSQTQQKHQSLNSAQSSLSQHGANLTTPSVQSQSAGIVSKNGTISSSVCVLGAGPNPQNNLNLGNNHNVTQDQQLLMQQLYYLQKQFYLKHRAAILSQLTQSEPWNMLSREQQQILLNQQMSQIAYPEYLNSLQALSQSLNMVSPVSFNLHQMLAAGKQEINQTKINPNWFSANNPNSLPLMSGIAPNETANNKSNEFAASNFNFHNLMHQQQQIISNAGAVVGPQTNSLGQHVSNHQVTSNSGPGNVNPDSNDPIKSLLIQLQMQKAVAAAAASNVSIMNNMNQWPSTTGVTMVIPQQHHLPPTHHQPQTTQTWATTLTSGQSQLNNNIPLSTQIPNQNKSQMNMWDYDALTSLQQQQQQIMGKSDIKTEKQIIEEQMQQQNQQIQHVSQSNTQLKLQQTQQLHHPQHNLHQKQIQDEVDIIFQRHLSVPTSAQQYKQESAANAIQTEQKQTQQLLSDNQKHFQKLPANPIQQTQHEEEQQQQLQNQHVPKQQQKQKPLKQQTKIQTPLDEEQNQGANQSSAGGTITANNFSTKKDLVNEDKGGKKFDSEEKPNSNHNHHNQKQHQQLSKDSGEEPFRKANLKNSNKKENKKHQSEEERKREQADEKRKQKEDKKLRQQLEEERKRQQQVEEEKRRETLDEEKRQKEIDLHRRKAIYEAYQQVADSKQKQHQRFSSSSVAPWSNTGLPGLTTPGPNLAEIQKAERERRTEEQRLEQILESQRKLQQVELMAAKESAQVKWNATPVAVKSLAEIQAEEARRFANEHHNQSEQTRRKDLEISASNTNASNSSAINPFSGIWNTKSSQSNAWNGNSTASIVAAAAAASGALNNNGNGSSSGITSANVNNTVQKGWVPTATTPSGSSVATSVSSSSNNVNNPNVSQSGFWEEPSKLVSNSNTMTVASILAAGLQSSSNTNMNTNANANKINHQLRTGLSKSQTISNMQTVRKDNQTMISQNAGGKHLHQQTQLTNTVNNNNSRNKTPPISNNKTNNKTDNNDIKYKKNQSGGNSNVSGGTSSTSNSGNNNVNTVNSNNGSGGNGNSNKKDDARDEFTGWCVKSLTSFSSCLDVPTFISFLQDIESPFEVKDYIRLYLGETKECIDFAKQFLERRSKYKNQQRAQNAHIDDMCVPAPAINPSSNDFQEVKGKGKKIKKSKMTKLDARILGFSVTAAQDRINVGDRDYGDAS